MYGIIVCYMQGSLELCHMKNDQIYLLFFFHPANRKNKYCVIVEKRILSKNSSFENLTTYKFLCKNFHTVEKL